MIFYWPNRTIHTSRTRYHIYFSRHKEAGGNIPENGPPETLLQQGNTRPCAIFVPGLSRRPESALSRCAPLRPGKRFLQIGPQRPPAIGPGKILPVDIRETAGTTGDSPYPFAFFEQTVSPGARHVGSRKIGSENNLIGANLGEPVAQSFGERGLPRDTARRLLETGGLVGLSPHPGFLGNFERHLEEIDFLAEVRPDQVVLGTDFAGTNVPGPGGNRLLEECKGVWGIPGFAGRLADIHGQDFAGAYCGRTLRAYLEESLSRAEGGASG